MIILTLTDEVLLWSPNEEKKTYTTLPFRGHYVIPHEGYGINDEVYMEASLQNLFYENCMTKYYLFELGNEVL
jgi:hypothetical protein